MLKVHRRGDVPSAVADIGQDVMRDHYGHA
jgi:hypothetical protein